MNQDIFCLDIPNQFSNITMSDNNELFDENNYDLSINQKDQFSKKINHFSINNSNSINSPHSIKNEYKTELDKEKEIKLNIDIHNINNNMNNNYCFINNTISNHFDNNNFILNSHFSNNICNCTCCKSSQYISFNDNINNIPYEENFSNSTNNYENNIFNFDDNNSYINIFKFNVNNNIKTKSLSNNNKNEIALTNNNNNIDSDYENNIIKSNKNIDKVNDKERNEKNDNINIGNNFSNNNVSKIIINLSSKRKLKKLKRKENKVNLIIEYGHPKKLKYKTMKQKLNIHKKLDIECRTDTLLFIYSISNLKKILTKILSKKNIKDKIYFNRIQNLYKNSILSLQHREYAQDITGYKLI